MHARCTPGSTMARRDAALVAHRPDGEAAWVVPANGNGTTYLGDPLVRCPAMTGEDGYFGEGVATTYDETLDGMFDPAVVEPTVAFLADLAGSGRALELGIGTGRIALRLAARGVPVHGIELSQAMVARLRAKPGGEEIPVTIGDFATAKADGTFRLAYLVFNTIENLTTQAAQVACFRNVMAHLEPGGCFVIEVAVPDLQRLPPGEHYVVFDAGESHWGIDEYDVANQGLISHHFQLVDGRFERSSGPFRYVWPSELDLMAQLAGMRLRERWAGWQREPFTSESRQHVSVWERSTD
jgi:SAM-dependent methyltransferase